MKVILKSEEDNEKFIHANAEILAVLAKLQK